MQPPCPVFDFHTHLYPDRIAAHVVAELAQRFGNAPAFDGTVDGLTRKLAATGFCGGLNLPVATRPDQVASINAWAAANNHGPVFSLATIHPDTADPQETLQAIRASGFKGIKLHPEYQLFTLDDPRMEPIWEACPSLDLFVFLHAGGERVFSPPYHSSPSAIAVLLARHPRLRLVAAHLGGFHMWDEAEQTLVGQPLFLDLSHTLFWMPDEQIVRMVRRHGAEHVIFGSDGPWQDGGTVLEAFLKLPFTQAEQEAILWQNASRLLGLSSPPTITLQPPPTT